jgi:hypothetical protein
VLVPALVATLVGLAFVAVFLDAFHDPVPHELPVAVVGSAQQMDSVAGALERQAPGHFSVVPVGGEPAARDDVLRRNVFGALVLTGPAPRLLVAGANGQVVTMTLSQALGPVVGAPGQQLQTQDIEPLAPGDARGLGIFYGAFGVVLGGFLFGILSY